MKQGERASTARETASEATCAIVDFVSYAASVPDALDRIDAAGAIADARKILIKPNLVNDSPHPVTTAPACCEAVIRYIRSHNPAAGIVIAEGCGEPSLETHDIFDRLGYARMAHRLDVPLVDLNDTPLVRLKNPACSRFPEFRMPEIALNHFIISVPVLKAHSLATITGTLKNMMGFVPPAHYSGSGGNWKKAAFHRDMHRSIAELNRYRTPDLTLLDASVGLADYHLGGATCQPPVKKLVAGFDPVAADRIAAELLGLDWRSIPHLQ